MKIFIATKNQKKLKELKRILIPMGFDVLCESYLDFPFLDAIEDGQTFEENAIIKAKSGLEQTGYITVADDSGICVDYLNGAPGVFSARYSGEHGNDEQNNDKLLAELSGVPMEKRTAYYVAAIACVFPDGRQFTVRGECHGHIAFERQQGSTIPKPSVALRPTPIPVKGSPGIPIIATGPILRAERRISKASGPFSSLTILSASATTVVSIMPS